MGLHSPIPVKLENESRKAAKIMHSFVDKKQNGLDKVIPRKVLERAQGFAIFTVVKAAFLFSARAGSGIVIARLPDGTWSPPSAIGVGGVGFGGQGGAEITDFFIVLNSRSAVSSFMAAGQLALGGNLSVAVGPLGRNAEGSGSLNTSGKLAAMYSYSKTKGLFGGVSVEGTVIVSRPDANRLAYGGQPTVKQILTGAFDWPAWAGPLIEEIEKCTGITAGSGGTGAHKWVDDEEGEGGGMGSGSPDLGKKGNGDYVFGGSYGGGGSTPPNGRKRAGSLFGNGDKGEKDPPGSRPNGGTKRTSSFNPFSTDSSSSRRATLPSSESYNAGMTWDSSGPMNGYGARNRSGSNPPRTTNGGPPGKFAVQFDSDYDEPSHSDYRVGDGSSGTKRLGGRRNDADEGDLLGNWDSSPNGLSTSFSRLSTGGKPNGGRSRSNSSPKPFQDIDEDESYGTRSTFTNGDRPSSSKLSKNRTNGHGPTAPFEDADDFRSPFENSFHSSQRSSSIPKIPLKAGLDSAKDGHARAIAQFDFTATDSGDLGFKSGQVVIVLDKVGNGDWWRGRGTDGREGIFPSNYVEVVDIPDKLVGGISKGELKARLGRVDFD